MQIIAALVDDHAAEAVGEHTAEKLKLALELLAQHFGKKFCFKCQAIIKEVTSNQLDPADANRSASRALTLPLSLWPLATAGVPACHPELASGLSGFEEIYIGKFKKRKLQVTLPYLGQVDLRYKRRLDIKVCGLQAQVLLMFNQYKRWPIPALATKVGLTPRDLLTVAERLKMAGLLEIESESSITVRENVGSVDAKQLRVRTIEILSMMEASQGRAEATPTLEQKVEVPSQTQEAAQSALPYVHKDHRYRVQAFIVKTLKKETSVTIGELEKRTVEQFSRGPGNMGPKDLIIDLQAEHLDKNIKDLCGRGFIQVDEDLNLYEYAKE